MNRKLLLFPIVGVLATTAGCTSAPFNPNPISTDSAPTSATVSTTVAASAAPSPAASDAPKPAASAPPKPAASTAPKPATSTAPKPAASTAPKPPVATPIPYQYKSFYFTYPTTWSLVKEVRNPAKLEFNYNNGDAEFTVRELPNTKSFAGERSRIVAEVGIGLVSNAATTLDSAPGFLIVWNRTEDGQSRYHATRGFVYKEAYFEIEANWNRPSPEMNAVAADIAAILKSWLWQ